MTVVLRRHDDPTGPPACWQSVVGVGLCCALPSLLAGGALVAVAGWGWGVWAAIGVAAVVTGTLWFRGRRQRARLVDPPPESLPESGSPESAQVGVAE